MLSSAVNTFSKRVSRQASNRFLSSTGVKEKVVSNQSMSTSEAVAKVASVAALLGAGVAFFLTPLDGDADFLDVQNHCHDESESCEGK